VAQSLRGHVDAAIQEGAEQGASLSDERRCFAGSVAGLGPQQCGQGRASALDGRVEIRAARRRRVGAFPRA
jgi:hypothetical protein